MFHYRSTLTDVSVDTILAQKSIATCPSDTDISITNECEYLFRSVEIMRNQYWVDLEVRSLFLFGTFYTYVVSNHSKVIGTTNNVRNEDCCVCALCGWISTDPVEKTTGFTTHRTVQRSLTYSRVSAPFCFIPLLN